MRSKPDADQVCARRAVVLWLASCALGAALAGCGGAVAQKLEPLEGYHQASSDAQPFDDASASCRRDAEFHTNDGTSFTDWRLFERCMNEHGWTREPAAAAVPASQPTGDEPPPEPDAGPPAQE